MPLADASVTEWRGEKKISREDWVQCHSLMLVLLNGGSYLRIHCGEKSVPLADASVTEWRKLSASVALVEEKRATR